jgi:hypothetical protein
MAFCPDCEAEYKAEVTVCPDCDVELVPELTSENRVHDKSHHEFVPLRSFKNSTEAQMVFELLEQNGIRAFFRAGDVGIFGSSFIGGAVMVDERDLPRAIEIYEAFFNAEPTAPPEDNQTDSF